LVFDKYEDVTHVSTIKEKNRPLTLVLLFGRFAKNVRKKGLGKYKNYFFVCFGAQFLLILN